MEGLRAGLVQSKACSCSYTLSQPLCPLRRTSRGHPNGVQRSHRWPDIRIAPVSEASDRRIHVLASSSSEQNKPKQKISGYTPANFVSYSQDPDDRCHYLIATEVGAPASLCFSIWNDWNRLVDFMDLISQIGLDPSQADMALFQCFYRWGNLPVLEIVFLLKKTKVEQDKLIQFETIHGMPASGEVQFIESEGRTTVLFKFEHQMPNLLVDLAVRTFGVETSCRQIFTENLAEFKQLAETLASNPGSAAPRQDAEATRIQVGVEAPEQEEPDAAEQQEELPAQAEVSHEWSAQTDGTSADHHAAHDHQFTSSPEPAEPVKQRGRSRSVDESAIVSAAALRMRGRARLRQESSEGALGVKG